MKDSQTPAHFPTLPLGFGTYFIRGNVLYRYLRPVIDGPPYYTAEMDAEVQSFGVWMSGPPQGPTVPVVERVLALHLDQTLHSMNADGSNNIIVQRGIVKFVSDSYRVFSLDNGGGLYLNGSSVLTAIEDFAITDDGTLWRLDKDGGLLWQSHGVNNWQQWKLEDLTDIVVSFTYDATQDEVTWITKDGATKHLPRGAW